METGFSVSFFLYLDSVFCFSKIRVLYTFLGKGMLLLAGTASSDIKTLSFSKFHVVCI